MHLIRWSVQSSFRNWSQFVMWLWLLNMNYFGLTISLSGQSPTIYKYSYISTRLHEAHESFWYSNQKFRFLLIKDNWWLYGSSDFFFYIVLHFQATFWLLRYKSYFINSFIQHNSLLPEWNEQHLINRKKYGSSDFSSFYPTHIFIFLTYFCVLFPLTRS